MLDREPKTNIFFFDYFGLDVLKHFLIQNHRNVFGTEKMTGTDNKITLCKQYSF